MNNHLQIWMDHWVYDYFAPEIESYCSILLDRISSIFDDVEGEHTRAASAFLEGIKARRDEDHDSVMEVAHHHALEHVWQFMEMRSVFLAVGVSGLFHLFERQLYRHINKELRGWLVTPIAEWRAIEDIVPRFQTEYGLIGPCVEFVNAFKDADLQELRLVANAVKHGDDGQSYKQLVARQARVVDPQRVEDDGNVGPYSILRVSISIQTLDVGRYRDAILRFWSLKGTFCAEPSAFK